MAWLPNVGRSWRFSKRCTHLIQRSFASSARETASRYKGGQKIGAYTVKKVVPVDELSLTAVLLQHDATRAQHLHVARDDSNNVFAVSFRTTPMDSTGVPHILEHTALCGSQRFPISDPFFKMLNRSLATFMNAMTASDWTVYPFSTQNKQDYENLLQVYLDSSFFPQLTKLDFRQEGWRLEHEDNKDLNSPIIFKGVVYNEMKGAFSNSQALFQSQNQRRLLPSHTYGVESGGDPRLITELTWQQLRDFHASHYHPSNSRFYTYGNFPLERHLELIQELALSKFKSIDPGTEVPPETRWKEPREEKISCSPDPMAAEADKQTTVAVSYLLSDITDVSESTTLSILGYLLTDGETSPFYQALLEANIGSDYSPVLGYDNHTKDAAFSVGLQGIRESDTEKVKQIIDETIDKVIKEGFEQERIAALLHRIELSQKHQHDKFGLHLAFSLLGPWTHDADPIELLQVNNQINEFKDKLASQPDYLQAKVKHYFKENPHRLTLVMSPDQKYDENLQQEESQRLQRKVGALTDEDRKDVYQLGLDLAEKQNKEQDLSCLPSLKVADIPAQADTYALDHIYADGVSLQLNEQPTCGVTYFRAVSNMRDLPIDLKPYVPLFCSIVTKMGAGVMDFKELSQKIELTTGGLAASPHINQHHTDADTFEESVVFSSYCLDKNFSQMMDLWEEIWHRLVLSDSNRLQTLVAMAAAEMAHSISGAGHTYAMSHAASHLSPTSRANELMSGVTQVSLMKRLAEMTDLGHVTSELHDIAHELLHRKNLRCSLNATPETMPTVVKETEKFIRGLRYPGKQCNTNIYTKESDFHAKSKQFHFELPFQVNYASRGVLTVPYAHQDFASLRILGRLMTNKYLHREVREKGGAYGGGATGNNPGLFSFYSYRDPNSMSTLDAFEGAVAWAQDGSFSQQDIDEAKLAIFAQVDSPVAPGQRGMRNYLFEIDDEMYQSHREQLFAVNRESLQRVTEQYLSKEKRTSAVALLGPENPKTKESNEWTVKKQ